MENPTAGIHLEIEDDVAVLRPWGTLDIEGAEQIRSQVDGLLGLDCDSVLLDLQHVGFMDASGLKELLRMRDAVRARGGALSVVNGKPQVRRFMDVVGHAAGRNLHHVPASFPLTRL